MLCTPVKRPACPNAGKALGECIQLVAERQGVPETEVGYEDVARAAFGRAGQVAVSVSMYTELYGICAVLFIVMVRRHSTPTCHLTANGCLSQNTCLRAATSRSSDTMPRAHALELTSVSNAIKHWCAYHMPRSPGQKSIVIRLTLF